MLKRFYVLAMSLVLALPAMKASYGQMATADLLSGLTITPVTKNDRTGKSVLRFNSYEIGTSGTIVFNNFGSTTAAAGVVDVAGYDKKSIVIEITDMQDAGTTTLYYYNGNGTTTMSNPIATFVYSGTSTEGFPIIEDPEYLKFGISRTGDSSAKVTVRENYSQSGR